MTNASLLASAQKQLAAAQKSLTLNPSPDELAGVLAASRAVLAASQAKGADTLPSAEDSARALVKAFSMPAAGLQDDALLAHITKAGSTTAVQSTGDLPELVQTQYAAMRSEVIAGSVLAQLAAMPGVMLGQIASSADVLVPFRKTGSAHGGKLAWVGEGKAIPLGALEFGADRVSPRKAGIILSWTEEMLRRFATFPALCLEAVRAESVEFLDKSLLGNAAATAEAPAGLLHGAATVAATKDPELDVSAVLDARPGMIGPYCIVMPSGLARKLRFARNDISGFKYPTMGGNMLAGLQVITSDWLTDVAVLDLSRVHICLPELGVDTSISATMHMASDTLADLSGAQPVRSAFQTATVDARYVMWNQWGAIRSDKPAATILTGAATAWGV